MHLVSPAIVITGTTSFQNSWFDRSSSFSVLFWSSHAWFYLKCLDSILFCFLSVVAFSKIQKNKMCGCFEIGAVNNTHNICLVPCAQPRHLHRTVTTQRHTVTPLQIKEVDVGGRKMRLQIIFCTHSVFLRSSMFNTHFTIAEWVSN